MRERRYICISTHYFLVSRIDIHNALRKVYREIELKEIVIKKLSISLFNNPRYQSMYTEKVNNRSSHHKLRISIAKHA